MRIRTLGLWLTLCALALAATGGRLGAEEPETPVITIPKNAPLYVPDEVLVTFKPGIQAQVGIQAGQRLGLSVAKDSDSPHFAKLKIPAGLRAQGATVPSVVQALRNDPAVRSADPNYYRYLTFIPNDNAWFQQWGPQQIGCTTAWDTTRGNTNLRVAVIDTGVDYNHPDLAANIARPFTGGPIIDADYAENDGDAMDDPRTGPNAGDSHGTHVAGIIGAVGNNTIGVSGVCPNTDIVPIRVFGDTGGAQDDWIIKGIDFARANNCQVINLSLGGPGYNQAVQDAVTRAVNAGRQVVCAAGNGGPDGRGDNNDLPANRFYPAGYDGCISVAATDNTDALTSFSNFGATSVHLAAPGASILSTMRGNQYGMMSGTSQAAPMVSGALALLHGHQLKLPPAELRKRLLELADPVAGLRGRIATPSRLSAMNLLGDPWEADDTAAKAKEYNGPRIHSFHSYSDADWVKFTLTEPADVFILAVRGADTAPEVNLQLALFNHELTGAIAVDDGGPGAISMEKGTRLIPDTYYVRCSTNAKLTPTYRLTITIQNAAKDAYEPDDTWHEARDLKREIKSGESQVRKIEAPRSGDWVYFDVAKLSDVVLETSGPNRNVGIRLSLFGADPRKDSIAVADNGGYARMDRTGDLALPPGRYYLVTEESGRDAPVDEYRLKLTITEVFIDTGEVDDTQKDAKLLEPGTPLLRSIHTTRDVDWFRFELAHPSEVVITAAGFPGRGAFMTLVNSAGQHHRSGFSMGSNTFRLEAENHLKPGTWYVSLESVQTLPRYTMSLMVAPIRPPNPPTEFKPEAMSSNLIRWTWKDPARDETGFEIQRQVGPTAWETDLIAEANLQTAGLAIYEPGVRYTFRIRTLGKWEIHSDWSPPVTITTPGTQPDLAGEWRGVTVKKKGRRKKATWTVKGSLFITNQGATPAGASKVKIFASADDKPGGDVPVMVTVNGRKVPLELPLTGLGVGQNVLLSTDALAPIKLKKAAYMAIKGKRLIAVLDFRKQVAEGEAGEKNNDVVSDAVP